MNHEPLNLKIIGVITAYFLVSLYYFGIITSNYLIIYPSFSQIHEHYDAYMGVFNASVRILIIYSSVALLLLSVLLLWFRPNTFPKPAMWAIICLSAISVCATLFFIMPIQLSLWINGFNVAIYGRLMDISLYFQIIPSFLQVLMGFWLLNRYLSDIKVVSRWVFILFFSITFWTGNYDALVNFSLYTTVGAKDWLAFREAIVPTKFFFLLIVAFTPMLLTIPMFWLRPKSVPKLFVGIYGLTIFWIFFITFIYIAKDLQGYLSHDYSRAKIEELINSDFEYRGLPAMVLTLIAAWMFLKIGQHKMKVGN
ncbi:hypothetical protein NAF17_10125 [Mucilaginibacter sp. RB4R14]|uniref:hypothetical protein n=1 Tax=Mucilaginibacter aurantiaciroseus TaxID=2949308 RepID=UPI0020913185|nr:hypothetical protein [Mucilaginibacter aurantiaciroseus]MCO5935900.1 hypothetical protein [Mucilaginibacter aurantiaciroseus]